MSGNYRRPQHGLISVDSVIEVAGRVQSGAGGLPRQLTSGVPRRRGCFQPSQTALPGHATSPDVRGKWRCDAPPSECERLSRALVSKACLTRVSCHAAFDGNRTVITNAICYPNGNSILGRRLADQGGRYYTVPLESRCRLMGVSPRVSAYSLTFPPSPRSAGVRRSFGIPVNVRMRVDKPVSGTPVILKHTGFRRNSRTQRRANNSPARRRTARR